MLRRTLLLGLALCAFGVALCRGQDTWQAEADNLAALLHWQAGTVVAEIGAGDGKLTVLAAQRVGPAGKVYTTELDEKKLAHLEKLAAKHRTITPVKAAEADTNLSPACCDSIFMRLVYHHLTKPAEIGASLLRSLKPGGRLAVIDEDPLEGSSIPEGVPKNREGHGIPQKILVSELTAAGFEVESIRNDWPSRTASRLIYCVVFRKTKP